jgi:hypothetical protein
MGVGVGTIYRVALDGSKIREKVFWTQATGWAGLLQARLVWWFELATVDTSTRPTRRNRSSGASPTPSFRLQFL